MNPPEKCHLFFHSKNFHIDLSVENFGKIYEKKNNQLNDLFGWLVEKPGVIIFNSSNKKLPR